jgi:hypothetical protein
MEKHERLVQYQMSSHRFSSPLRARQSFWFFHFYCLQSFGLYITTIPDLDTPCDKSGGNVIGASLPSFLRDMNLIFSIDQRGEVGNTPFAYFVGWIVD